MSAGLRISESMMMIRQVESTICCHGMQLIILQIREYFERCLISTMELVVRISHLIMCEASFQATLIKVFVMSDKRKVSHIFGRFAPYLRKDRRIISVLFFLFHEFWCSNSSNDLEQVLSSYKIYRQSPCLSR